MGASLDRLLRPRAVAVVGGGGWAAKVIATLRGFGHDGPIWAVHPSRSAVADVPTVARVQDLPASPDAVFLGINRHASVDVLRALADMGAGGAVAFASGFAEAQAEMPDGRALQDALCQAAEGMAVLGPNCYGFVNALDRVALWPDQHGLVSVQRGVALLSQSSNIALNLSMQRRGLPIGFLGTLGNQAQIDIATLGAALLEDDRITALGLYVEGIPDAPGFEQMARMAAARGKHIVALRSGRSAEARLGNLSHSASLAGSSAGADAFLARCGVAQVGCLASMIEALKILHVAGPLPGQGIVSASCSGGEAALIADLGSRAGLRFPPLDADRKARLAKVLGPRVALANPLDYHTYIWGDRARMQAVFDAMRAPDLRLGIVVLDFPRNDRCDLAEWPDVVEAVVAAARTGPPMALLSSLPDTMPEPVAQDLMARGVVPLCGLSEALEAVAACAWLAEQQAPGTAMLWAPVSGGAPLLLGEGAAKARLAACGIAVPNGAETTAAQCGAAAASIGFPVVLKALGCAHKTEVGAVALGLRDARAVQDAAVRMGAARYLVEAQIDGAVAEMLVSVLRDPCFGFVLTLGAGGVQAELQADVQHLILPVTSQDIAAALDRLRLAPVLSGYRGRPGADRGALVRMVLAVQDYVTAHAGSVEEVEINPALCLPDGTVAADALIRIREEN